MGNLTIGTDVINMKEAVNIVRKNISELEEKIKGIRKNSYAASQITAFYDQKLTAQN